MVNTPMRRASFIFLTASLLVHAGLGASGVWLGKRATKNESTPKVVFTGETFDVGEEETRAAERSEVVPVEAPRDEKNDDALVQRARARVVARGEPTQSAREVEAPLTYGALGDRSAADVTVAIARGFPQAASTDPIWKTVPFGAAGDADLDVEIDEAGQLVRWGLGANATPALRQAFVRTFAFIGGRSFLARARVTKLHVQARVTADAVRDGTDAVYAIHSEHEGRTANAYFSLSSGRRVDLVITPAK